jgi:hypothetical protein
VLRNEQLQVFEDHSINTFYEESIIFLRDKLPEQKKAFTEKQLLELLKECHTKCEKFGIFSERGIVKWTFLHLVCGAEFDQKEEVSHYLENMKYAEDDFQMLFKEFENRLQSKVRKG